ncbi:LysE family transporter [Streptomyces natalensis]|uniref:Lysine transporter LysE n=1 Tax=Streptomyces natalensis ATCC 27448 TaxID=1240678 RepID=A0A0D7CLR3_9ACTN|nr:LysE family transporter [Streptomyces natalensis]KIZ16775.1 lysine transporter LysE [Streptomyces natalensis ATCC 27448]
MDGQLMTFTAVAAGMVALPGADFAVVVRQALDSRRAGVAAALGVAGGLLVHTALAVAGLAAVLVAVPTLFETVQLLGGGYLLYLGIRSLSAAARQWSAACAERPAAEAQGGSAGNAPAGNAPAQDVPAHGPRPRATARRSTAHSLRQGFLTNALNPKAPVLFLSLLPQFVPAGQPPLPRTLVLAAIVVAMAAVWFPAVALLVDRLGGQLRRPPVARALEAATGTLLTVLGSVLLAELVLA